MYCTILYSYTSLCTYVYTDHACANENNKIYECMRLRAECSALLGVHSANTLSHIMVARPHVTHHVTSTRILFASIKCVRVPQKLSSTVYLKRREHSQRLTSSSCSPQLFSSVPRACALRSSSSTVLANAAAAAAAGRRAAAGARSARRPVRLSGEARLGARSARTRIALSSAL